MTDLKHTYKILCKKYFLEVKCNCLSDTFLYVFMKTKFTSFISLNSSEQPASPIHTWSGFRCELKKVNGRNVYEIYFLQNSRPKAVCYLQVLSMPVKYKHLEINFFV